VQQRLITIITIIASLGLAACDPLGKDAGEVDPSGSSSEATATAGTAESTSTGPSGASSQSDGISTTGGSTDALDDPGIRLDVNGIPLDVNGNPDCVDWASQGCGSPSVRGVVEGTTPLGAFTTTLAVFGGNAGCAGGCEVSPNIARIHLAADPAVIEQLDAGGFSDETLVLELDLGEGAFEGPTGEPVGAILYANRDAMTVQTLEVEVVLDLLPTVQELDDRFDPDTAVVVTGSMAAEGDGWSVAGAFAASYCPNVNQSAICE
jgi:hypothetical protein